MKAHRSNGNGKHGATTASPLEARREMINAALDPLPPALVDVGKEKRPTVTGGCIQVTHKGGFAVWVRLASVSMVILDAGQVGGPFIIRVDGMNVPLKFEAEWEEIKQNLKG